MGKDLDGKELNGKELKNSIVKISIPFPRLNSHVIPNRFSGEESASH
jgi:hypothetical protein